MENRTNTGKYSETFKIYITSEIESGRLSVAAANRKYNIAGHMTVSKWCRKYGTCINKKVAPKRKIMAQEEHEIVRLHNEVKALKDELENARMKNVVLETMVDIVEKELEIPIRKKYGAKQSGR